MNISEQFDFIKHHSLYCLYPLRLYVYLNIFNYCILQYIIYIYIYPRWLGMLIDKGNKEKWLPLQLLTETQEKKTGEDIQQQCAKTHQANQAPQASKTTQIKCKCKEFKKTQRQHKNIASTISVSQFLLSLVHYE